MTVMNNDKPYSIDNTNMMIIMISVSDHVVVIALAEILITMTLAVKMITITTKITKQKARTTLMIITTIQDSSGGTSFTDKNEG